LVRKLRHIKRRKEENVTLQAQTLKTTEAKGFVYCPICTHTVEAIVVSNRKTAKVKPGQKCSRCSASLDPGYIMRLDRAA
jgi:transposase-like protein